MADIHFSPDSHNGDTIPPQRAPSLAIHVPPKIASWTEDDIRRNIVGFVVFKCASVNKRTGRGQHMSCLSENIVLATSIFTELHRKQRHNLFAEIYRNKIVLLYQFRIHCLYVFKQCIK